MVDNISRRNLIMAGVGSLGAILLRCVPVLPVYVDNGGSGGNGGGSSGGGNGGDTSGINPANFTDPEDFLNRSEVS